MNYIITAVGHDGSSLLQVVPDLASTKELLERISKKDAKNARNKRCDLVVFAIYN